MDVLHRAFDKRTASLLNAYILKRNRGARKRYVREFQELPNVVIPRSYNEKMFWRRVLDRNPAFISHCDKLATKNIFASLKHPLPSFETLWIGERPEDLPQSLWRDDIVIKHNAGCNRNWFFAREGYDREAFNEACHAWMKETYGLGGSEWAYSQVHPLLFAEKVLEAQPERLIEFKVHLFHGQVFYTVVYVGEKTPNALSAIYSESGERLPVTTTIVMRDPGRALPDDFELPDTYEFAMTAAREVAKDLDYVRVDFLNLDGQLFAGEITPYPTAGLMTNSDPAVLKRMGEVWDLRKTWFMQTKQSGWSAIAQGILRRSLDQKGEAPIAPKN